RRLGAIERFAEVFRLHRRCGCCGSTQGDRGKVTAVLVVAQFVDLDEEGHRASLDGTAEGGCPHIIKEKSYAANWSSGNLKSYESFESTTWVRAVDVAGLYPSRSDHWRRFEKND